MNHPISNASMSAKLDVGASNFHHGMGSRQSISASVDGPVDRWESPAFEEFDLCMEVTAYVHQWE